MKIKSFHKVYRDSLQNKIIDKIEYESLFNFLLSFWMKQKISLVYKFDPRNEIKSLL